MSSRPNLVGIGHSLLSLPGNKFPVYDLQPRSPTGPDGITQFNVLEKYLALHETISKRDSSQKNPTVLQTSETTQAGISMPGNEPASPRSPLLDGGRNNGLDI